MRRLAVVATALSLAGCAGSFEEARLGGLLNDRVGADKRDVQHCRDLDADRATWGGIGKGSALLAGGAGLSTVQTEGHLQTGLAIGSVAAGAIAAGAVYISEAKGDAWARECSR